MEITEVRIKLMEDTDDRLQAFCSITFDDAFVIRDLKIIEGDNGPFVAMPSRKLTAHCPECRAKNHLRATFCNSCGVELEWDRPVRDVEGRTKLYADVAHPINRRCREMIQERVIAEFEAELRRAEEPGYISRYDDDYDAEDAPEWDTFELPRDPAGPRASGSTASRGRSVPPSVEPPPRPEPPRPEPHRPAARPDGSRGTPGGDTHGRGPRVDSTTIGPTAPPPLLPPPKSRLPDSPARLPDSQAPEPQPPPPHLPPERTEGSPAGKRVPGKPARRGEFGAGVFDDERRSS